jgi:hypothetical protein
MPPSARPYTAPLTSPIPPDSMSSAVIRAHPRASQRAPEYRQTLTLLSYYCAFLVVFYRATGRFSQLEHEPKEGYRPQPLEWFD